jgi:hypothetical protein
MKKLLLLFLVLISSVTFAQDSQNTQTTEPDKRDITQNELSIGALNLVAFGALDLTYERIIDKNSSWAIEGFIKALDREPGNTNISLATVTLVVSTFTVSECFPVENMTIIM